MIIEDEDNINENCKSISEGNYVTLKFKGTHKEAKKYYAQMIKYIEDKNYVICGDAIETTLIDYGMTNDIYKFTTEIQIPYKKIL